MSRNVYFTNLETGEKITFEVQGFYAPQHLDYLASKAPARLSEMYNNGELGQYAEKFEDEIGEKVMKMFIKMRDKCRDYAKAQAMGDIESAEKFANNDLETAKQFAMREWVYAL
jgi:hypothetical protein